MRQPETIFVITLTASAMTIRFGAILNTLPKPSTGRSLRCQVFYSQRTGLFRVMWRSAGSARDVGWGRLDVAQTGPAQ